VRGRTITMAAHWKAVERQGRFESQHESRSARRDNIRDDLALRLRHVCSHLAEPDFQALVSTMTEQKLRSEQKGSL
jgi:hypothetical protein